MGSGFDAPAMFPSNGSITWRPLPSPGSTGVVPRVPRYYEALRFPAALPDTLRFLRMTVTTPLRLSSFLLPSPTPTCGREVWGLARSQSQMLKRWKRQGVPSSWGILMYLRPVLRPRRDRHGQAIRQVGTAPRASYGESSPREVISGLNHTASALAVYASQCGSHRPTQDSLLAAGQALPDGIGYP